MSAGTPVERDIAFLTASRIPAPETPRKIVQIATMPGDDIVLHTLFALCDDGSLWSIADGDDWKVFDAIPQGPGA